MHLMYTKKQAGIYKINSGNAIQWAVSAMRARLRIERNTFLSHIL